MSVRDVVEAQRDAALMVSRRAFPESQRLWEGPAVHSVASEASLAWHGGDLHPETGATGLVRRESAYEDLIGDLVRLTLYRPTGNRSVTVYLLESADRESDFSISRRAFLALGHLANESLTVEVEVVEPGGP